jgi:hypothetical protein
MHDYGSSASGCMLLYPVTVQPCRTSQFLLSHPSFPFLFPSPTLVILTRHHIALFHQIQYSFQLIYMDDIDYNVHHSDLCDDPRHFLEAIRSPQCTSASVV